MHNELWETRAKEVAELKKKRKELKKQLKVNSNKEELKEQIKVVSKDIHKLQNAINQHEKHKGKVRTNTVTYKMFGKPLKELTKEEYGLYQSRGERRKRKNIIF